jgi:hypothetical protein
VKIRKGIPAQSFVFARKELLKRGIPVGHYSESKGGCSIEAISGTVFKAGFLNGLALL